jgi:CRP-like cAMP-binding protein
VASEPQDRLQSIALLADLPDDARRELERQCRWRRFGAGEQILDKDSEDKDVYFVASGSVQVVNYSITGREIAFAKVNAGGHFGELSAIDGQPRSASVVAAEASLLGSVPPRVFLDRIAHRPEIAVKLLHRLAAIVRSCDERIMDLSTLGAVQRVYQHILRLAEESPVAPGAYLIRAMPTHKTIAAMASTTRETVARSLSQLSGTGIIERKGRILHIRDRDALERAAGALAMDESGGIPR